MARCSFSSLVLLLLLVSTGVSAFTAPKPGCSPKDLPLKRSDWVFRVETSDGEWSHSLTTSEASEGFLGTAVFDSLPDRFASIPGVTKVEQEDREHYLIQSHGLSTQQLKEALWQKFRAAAVNACGRGQQAVSGPASAGRT